MNQKYSLVRDTLDSRDLKFSVAPIEVLPAQVDLRPRMPAVYDQGQLGSCSGNAVAAAFQYDQLKESITSWTPSRLFIYYNERLLEGTTNKDDGAQLRDGIKVISTYGVCDESIWVYDIAKFTQKPSDEAYSQAKLHTALLYQRVDQTLSALKHALASNFPVVVGITLFDAFESQEVAESGIVPMPHPTDNCLGGHAVVVVGYDDAKQLFTMRNSWGPDWGDQGYFYLPYEYLTNPQFGMDYWVVTSVQ